MIKLSAPRGLQVQLAETKEDLISYFTGIELGEIVVFDWETDGLHYNCLPLGLSLYNNSKGVSMYVPIDFYFPKGLSIRVVVDICNKYYKGRKMVGHNLKFDSMVNKMHGILDENCVLFADTMVMGHLIDPELKKGLEESTHREFRYAKKPFKELVGKAWDKINWKTEGEELLTTLAIYAGEDTYWTYKLFEKYSNNMDEDAWRVHNRIEIPFIYVLRDMKIRGISINVPFLEDMAVVVQNKITELTNNIYELAGRVFNLNSPKQKQVVFFDVMKLPVISYTKTGAPSTDSNSMEAWAEMGYEIGNLLVSYSEVQKLLSGYILGIPRMVDKVNVLRGDIDSCGTKTGRCSSSNPNLQNQPNNHEFQVRRAFVPREGYKFLNYDYSQLELRVMAHMSKDKNFTTCFRNGEDPHGDVAKRLDITRKGAKVVNFGVLYGMGPDKLANTLGISVEEASKIISKDFMNTYDGFARWKELTESFARKNGYVKNLFGRVRRLPDATSDRDRKAYYGALRRSVNTIIQGTGADIVKLAMNAIYKKFKEENLEAHLLLQVHDEVLVEAKECDLDRAREIVIQCMSQTVLLDVPLEVDGKTISNWAEMKEEAEPIVVFDYTPYLFL
jgi:DNA polymerase-1